MKDNLEINKQKLGVDSWLKLIEEDKNLNGAYISIAQYIWLLEKELEKLNNINKEYERLNKEYNIDELLSCKKYKDNWGRLKEWVKEQPIFNYLAPVDIKNKMHELERSDSNE